MDVRRVVTGHDEQGRAVFVSDERVAPVRPSLLPGTEFHRLWGGDAPPRFPDAGAMPAHTGYFPPLGGVRFGFFTLPPDEGRGVPPDLDVAGALAELEEMLPGLAAHMEPEAPGMHTTATVDFEVVLSGEVQLELDDGATVRLGPGDTVVQNGTRHRWSNPGSEPAVLAVFIVGAHHDRVQPAQDPAG
ncbi:MAG TPA: cupin domain-containing protein [Acidimicrobiales bacterium]